MEGCGGRLCFRPPILAPWHRGLQVEEDNEESEAAHQEALAALEVSRVELRRSEA